MPGSPSLTQLRVLGQGARREHADCVVEIAALRLVGQVGRRRRCFVAGGSWLVLTSSFPGNAGQIDGLNLRSRQSPIVETDLVDFSVLLSVHFLTRSSRG